MNYVAYTHYAFFEWALIFFDVFYDAISEQELAEADLKVRCRCDRFKLFSVRYRVQITVGTAHVGQLSETYQRLHRLA